ncbi:MAG: DUF4260 domain-containing protein [Fodinibius sp.]|nr:DUF4260 domain-containing protein [Fodinibius sp.]
MAPIRSGGSNENKNSTQSMKHIIKLEEAALLFLSVLLFTQTGFAWWLFAALLLVPDISMVGYGLNNRFGAFLYNIFHHKGIAILVYGIGYLIEDRYLELAGVILLGHSSMDRMFGYGLKFADSFKHTHLGKIG